ncbi:MAG: hypothetical protein AABX34_06265 [Nanoarchaeota archaeon]
MAKNRQNVKKNIKKDLFTFNNAVLFALMLALIVLFKTIMAPVPAFEAAEKADLEQEAKTLLDTVAAEGNGMSLIASNELSEEKIKYLGNMNYNEFKGILGVKNDFCVYFEDVSGNLIKIDGVELGIGSEKIRINGKPCN